MARAALSGCSRSEMQYMASTPGRGRELFAAQWGQRGSGATASKSAASSGAAPDFAMKLSVNAAFPAFPKPSSHSLFRDTPPFIGEARSPRAGQQAPFGRQN